MKRHQFHHNDLTLSYLDTGGGNPILIALHAHWMEASTYNNLAKELERDWRIIALDQRGHGDSDHAQSYSRTDYLGDLYALFEHVGINSAVLMGNSLGGVNAYQFAARHPERVTALIIEDIGAVVDADISFVLPWGGVFQSREALADQIGPRMLPYLVESIRHTSGGWRLPFDPQEMVESQSKLNGDHWADWLATDCAALLIRGRESRVTTQTHLEEMAARRPKTRLVTMDGGHVVHQDNLNDFTNAVRGFLHGL